MSLAGTTTLAYPPSRELGFVQATEGVRCAYPQPIYSHQVDNAGRFAAWEQAQLFSAGSVPRLDRCAERAQGGEAMKHGRTLVALLIGGTIAMTQRSLDARILTTELRASFKSLR
jgi:hypothetical protein